MPKDLMSDSIALEHKIRVLEEENAQLAERAEESLLIGLISENLQAVSDENDVFGITLERISILKAIPFVACGYIDHDELKYIAGYCAFTDMEGVGFPMTVSPELIKDLEYGPVVAAVNDGLHCHFENDSFQPTYAALIAFSTQTHANAIFVFMDSDINNDRLNTMLVLLSQIVHMAATRYDNIFLLKEVTRVNRELEKRVEKRTEDLVRTNALLEQEIKEHKASEKALKEAHQAFFTVLNSIDATIYVADLNTYEILFMNQHMIDTFGDDFTGKTCFKMFRDEDRPCGVCTNNRLLDERGEPAGVVVWQGKNPITGKDYVNYDRAIRWVDGRLVRLQIATDITPIKKMESQLQQSLKFEAIGTLAGGIAHDFNNLLMGIQGRASLMQMDLGSHHPCLEHVDAIMECTRSATNLTKQMLGVARGGKYEVRPIKIDALVQHSATMFGRTKKEIRIHTKFHEPSPVAAVDRTQIEQVLLNLYINAWQAMPEGGDLYLETSVTYLGEKHCEPHNAKPGNFARISVTDTGIGMDEQTLRRVFDPFFTTKEKGRGTGLGLASAYGIVNNHSGFITVDSEPGQGTIFTIYLPISDQNPHQDGQVREDVEPGSETILLVDDEAIITDVTRPILEKLGYRVLVAENGEKSVDLVQQHADNIDLIILDMVMPGMDGEKTFNRIRKIQPKIPVILSSGYSLNEKANKIIQKGCNGFIQKPFNVSNLSREIRRVLGTK